MKTNELRKMDREHILDLMADIENKNGSGKCFHEIYPELDLECRKYFDGNYLSYCYLNSKLTKILDEVSL